MSNSSFLKDQMSQSNVATFFPLSLRFGGELEKTNNDEEQEEVANTCCCPFIFSTKTNMYNGGIIIIFLRVFGFNWFKFSVARCCALPFSINRIHTGSRSIQ